MCVVHCTFDLITMDKPTMNKKTALVLGIPSGIVILGGLLVLVLVHVLMATISGSVIRGYRYEYASWPFWVIGLGYIIPGYFGLVCALIQNKGLYIASIVITILLLLTMAGVTIFVIILMFVIGDNRRWDNSDDCYDDVRGVCVCSGDEFHAMLSMSCSSYKTVTSLSVAVSFFLVFTWVSQLVMFVLCCYYTCCAKTGFSQGIVITTNQQQPMIVLNQNTSSAFAQNMSPTNLPPWQSLDQAAPNKVLTGV